MPRGSEYQGPRESFDRYTAVVASASADTTVKGAKNPYTSHNGHMFSFLDPEGNMALRLSKDLRTEFEEMYESGPVIRYDSVMSGYASVPSDLLERTAELAEWFDRSFRWVGTLDPKSTTKK